MDNRPSRAHRIHRRADRGENLAVADDLRVSSLFRLRRKVAAVDELAGVVVVVARASREDGSDSSVCVEKDEMKVERKPR